MNHHISSKQRIYLYFRSFFFVVLLWAYQGTVKAPEFKRGRK